MHICVPHVCKCVFNVQHGSLHTCHVPLDVILQLARMRVLTPCGRLSIILPSNSTAGTRGEAGGKELGEDGEEKRGEERGRRGERRREERRWKRREG